MFSAVHSIAGSLVEPPTDSLLARFSDAQAVETDVLIAAKRYQDARLSEADAQTGRFLVR